ncbi:hypothetical protein [Endozoicomonas sp. ONNA2]|uniref:hypothetical protein n=1 Tax=Endozoicomonas sp. ONNA2 TaxID=2828741 RepID=UPI00214790BB|nr:hypothetical protein [Endozoicomonas sp. ONNA2]
MLNLTNNQLPSQLDKPGGFEQKKDATAKDPEFTFNAKPVTLAEANPSAPESASTVIYMSILERSVKSACESASLPGPHLDDPVSWSQLPSQIKQELTPCHQLLFAIYLGLPIAEINKKNVRHNHEHSTKKFDYLSWYSQQHGLAREKLTIPHGKLLTMLGGISRPDLVARHCDTFGLAVDQKQFCSEWPAGVRAVDTHTALNHELDFFKLQKIFIDDDYLRSVPTATVAYCAGYPKLMKDQDLQQRSIIVDKCLSTPLLLKKILDTKEGRMTVNELVKILSKPEIMAINTAGQLIESLKGFPPRFNLSEQHKRSLKNQIHHYAYDLGAIGMDAESFGRALGLPLHIIQKILYRICKNEHGYLYITKLLHAAFRCLPQLTSEHVAYASSQAARSSNCVERFEELIAGKRKRYPWFCVSSPEQPPVLKPLVWQAVHNGGRGREMAGSKPLTLDFLSRLPLSHNWFLIGLAMGLSQDELTDIGNKTKVNFRVSANELSIAASELSRILVQSKRGLETGHLYQALEYLDDQATLAYFPEHLSVHPDKPLPEHTAESIESGRSLVQVLRTFKTEELERFLKLFGSYEEMKYQLPREYRVWRGWKEGKHYEPGAPYVPWSTRNKATGKKLG